MNEQELARALFSAGLLTQDQVQAAAAQRTADVGFADVVVSNGWVTAEQIRQVSGGAVNVGAWDTSSTAPPAAPPPVWQAAAAPVGYGVPMASSPPTVDADGVNPNATVDVGKCLSRAWALLTANLGIWVGAIVVFLIIQRVAQMPASLLSMGAQIMPKPQKVDEWATFVAANAVSMLVGQAINMVVNAFLMAGLYKMALDQIDGRELSLNTLFSGGALFANMLLGQLLVGLACLIGALACIIPLFMVVGGLVFWTPLLVDKNLDAVSAIKLSWKVVNARSGQLLSAILFVIITGLVSVVGAVACCIGIVITLPLAYLMPAVLYRDFFPATGVRESGGASPGLGAGGGAFAPPIPDPNS